LFFKKIKKIDSSFYSLKLNKKFVKLIKNDYFINYKIAPPENFKFRYDGKYIRVLLSSNLDYSLFNVLPFSQKLIFKDFIIFLRFILYNNLTKFFKNTKSEKTFIFLNSLLKSQIFYFTVNFNLINLKANRFKFLFRKKVKYLYIFVDQTIFSFILNLRINSSIAS
jgi:hypothetical protein